jgi:peptidyl-prolyl cis-trans isomerase C
VGEERPASDDRPVARVNGREISAKSVQLLLFQLKEHHVHRGKKWTPELERSARDEALHQLVNRELLYEESTRRGLLPPTEKVEGQIDELARQAGGLEELKNLLTRRQMDLDAVREGIRRDMAVDTLLDQELKAAAVVGELEAKTFYADNRQTFQLAERLLLGHISIEIPRNAWPDSVRRAEERLTKIRERILAGASFEEVGRQAVTSEDGIQSSVLGPLEPGKLRTDLRQLAASLPLGEMSHIVRSGIGIHLLRVVAREAARYLDYDEVSQHVIAYLKMRKRNSLTDTFTGQLRKAARIEILTY